MYGSQKHGTFCYTYRDWEPFAKHKDSLNNIARQNSKRKENLESIACAEGEWFVLHSNRATSNSNLLYVGATNQLRELFAL